jgi:hypothetical protein
VNRLHQFVLIVSILLGSWLGMQAVHETGHVLGAWLTGGGIARVVLWPLSIWTLLRSTRMFRHCRSEFRLPDIGL